MAQTCHARNVYLKSKDFVETTGELVFHYNLGGGGELFVFSR